MVRSPDRLHIGRPKRRPDVITAHAWRKEDDAVFVSRARPTHRAACRDGRVPLSYLRLPGQLGYSGGNEKLKIHYTRFPGAFP